MLIDSPPEFSQRSVTGKLTAVTHCVHSVVMQSLIDGVGRQEDNLGIASYLAGVPAPAATMAGLATLMAVCWVTEIVPIPVTSLFPLALFPLFGVADLKVVGASYGRPVIFFFAP